MKLLLISWHFPPANTIAAVRLGKLAKFLDASEIDFRVLTARDCGMPETLPLEIASDRIVRAPWIDLSGIPSRLRRAVGPASRRPPAGSDTPVPTEPARATRGLSLGEVYRNLVNIPDAQAGWLPYALRAGRRLLGSWRPDVIYASAPPFTGLLVASRLAGLYGIPWVAELRDRWVDDSFVQRPGWRRRLDGWLERRVVGSARALVTVSDEWAELFRRKLGVPTLTVLNGFDPADFPAVPAPPAPDGPLTIIHAGTIYPGHRDPSPLFRAARSLDVGRDCLNMLFLGASAEQIMPLAQRAGVADLVQTRPRIPYRDSIAALCRADVLLLLQWDSPTELGNIPAKLFEYLAARRPILGLGPTDGIPARIIRTRGAGRFPRHPDEIGDALRHWLAAKRTGGIAALPEAVCQGFAREEQFRQLIPMLTGLIAAPARASMDVRRQPLGPMAS